MTEPLSESEKRIFDAIVKNDVSAMSALLVGKQNVNIVDENLMTPLQHAAYKGNKEMVQILLDQGADVNLCKHPHDYSSLHFAALSGNADICLQLLTAGAKAQAQNTLNRTPSQMAAFVGNHNCVATINTFIPPSEVNQYTETTGDQKALLPNYIADSFHTFIMQTNIFPVRVAINLQNFSGLSKHLETIQSVLENMRDKEMKRKELREVIAFKLHYLSQIVIKVNKLRSTKESEDKKSDLTEQFTKKFLKVGKNNSTPYMDEVLVECIRCFPYRESTLFRQMVTSLANGGGSPFGIINAAINGQRGFSDNISVCDTCREEKATKKCSKCRVVQYCDRNCQRLHWFAHKKECAKLATEGPQEPVKPDNVDMSSLQNEISQIIGK